mmetsp:Transcript_30328/g.52406  ORF Transcript_30328/g.52406 Transcript_30328/m.52406 type:complete len:273 (-) Transcript_30328:303-1121(-)
MISKHLRLSMMAFIWSSSSVGSFSSAQVSISMSFSLGKWTSKLVVRKPGLHTSRRMTCAGLPCAQGTNGSGKRGSRDRSGLESRLNLTSARVSGVAISRLRSARPRSRHRCAGAHAAPPPSTHASRNTSWGKEARPWKWQLSGRSSGTGGVASPRAAAASCASTARSSASSAASSRASSPSASSRRSPSDASTRSPVRASTWLMRQVTTARNSPSRCGWKVARTSVAERAGSTPLGLSTASRLPPPAPRGMGRTSSRRPSRSSRDVRQYSSS